MICGANGTYSIFVSTRWRIPIRWCAVGNLHFRCGVGAISVASNSRCISTSTGMPQKVRIVRPGSSLLVSYPHIRIIKGGLCCWTFFWSRSGQEAPASVANISEEGVILSLFIVRSISISVMSISTLIMPGLTPVLGATITSAVAFLLIGVFRLIFPVIKACFMPPFPVSFAARATRSCSLLQSRPGHHGPLVYSLVWVYTHTKTFLMQDGNDVILHPFLGTLTNVSWATYT